MVCLATAWGTKFGGINSFNFDMCCALSAVLSHHEIVCVVLEGNDADANIADQCGVILISLKRPHDNQFDRSWNDEVLGALSGYSIPANLVDWWIGHDLKSGEVAVELGRKTDKPSAVIMHVSFDSYIYTKHLHSENPHFRIERQRKLFVDAPVSFAVGPLLYDRLTDLRACPWRITKITPLSGFGIGLDNASAIDND